MRCSLKELRVLAVWGVSFSNPKAIKVITEVECNTMSEQGPISSLFKARQQQKCLLKWLNKKKIVFLLAYKTHDQPYVP